MAAHMYSQPVQINTQQKRILHHTPQQNVAQMLDIETLHKNPVSLIFHHNCPKTQYCTKWAGITNRPGIKNNFFSYLDVTIG